MFSFKQLYLSISIFGSWKSTISFFCLRYNISTGDFDGWDSSVNSSLNSKPKQKTKVDIGEKFGMNSTEADARGYVYKQNPVVSLFGGAFSSKLKLRLAINTNQLGRVFQDRWVMTQLRVKNLVDGGSNKFWEQCSDSRSLNRLISSLC